MARNFLQVCDFSSHDLLALLARALDFEEAFHRRALPPLLRGKRVALSFEDDGFRNRVAFELGVRSMGGEAIYVPGRLGQREPAGDIARYLSNWFDAVVIRTPEYKIIEEFAQAAGVPVINARTRHNHPCEILGDLAFVRKKRGELAGLKVVFVGEATNLCHSWFEAGTSLPIEVVQVCPPGYEINSAYLSTLQKRAQGNLRVSHELVEEVKRADVVYTDCWPQDDNRDGAKTVLRAFGPFQLTAGLLDEAPKECLFLPCPPVTRGQEVSVDAMTSRKCVVYEAKEFLLHAQNALLATIIT
jgi:ornithine carbamoyltransferase